LGYLSLKDSQNPENSYGFNKKYSEHTAERIDEAVKSIIKQNYNRTKTLINEHKDKLETMAKTLLDKEVLDHNDLKELLGDHPEGKYPEGIFENEEASDNTNGSRDKTVREKTESTVEEDNPSSN
jgi:cell division protease FtsH